MSTWKESIDKSLKFWFLKPDGTISITKTLGHVAAASAAIATAPVTIPAMLATVGVTGVVIVLPAAVIKTAAAVGVICGYIAAYRAKNAMDDSKAK